MRLKILIKKYVEYRRSFGEKFLAAETTLLHFCRLLGNINLKNITPAKVKRYLYGTGPVTTSWFRKYSALNGLYSFGVSRGYVSHSPLPTTLPKQPPLFVPYVYTREELRKILRAASQVTSKHVHAQTIRMLFLLLYGTGIRLNEALTLTTDDVDQDAAVITIHQTKFYKSRLVPFGTQLAKIIRVYFIWYTRIFGNRECSPFLSDRNGIQIKRHAMTDFYPRIRKKAGIKRTDGGKYQPRLHDIRHTFAVHRLVSWYKEGANVQMLLPFLSTYLGHTTLAATSVYLSMTDDLLQEANMRFEHYAMGGAS